MEHYQEDRTRPAGNQNKASERKKQSRNEEAFSRTQSPEARKTLIYLTTLFSCIFVGGWFWFAEAGSHSTAPSGLELTTLPRLALDS